MPKFARFLLAVLSLLSCLAIWNCQTGGSELPNEISGQLVASNHRSVGNVRVGLYSVNYIPADSNNRGLAWTTQTDSSGNYTFKNIPAGRYNVVGLRDSVGFFRDSISISGEAALGKDSLRLLGTLTGIVQLQPQDDAQNAVVQVMGTDNYTNVAAGGAFTLKGLADGTYRIRVSVALPNYVELFTDVRVRSGMSDTLPHPLIPFYSGIPVVENIRVAYDTALGIAKITWHPVAYPALLGYLVYRDARNSLNLSTTPINLERLTDTVFFDRLYRNGNDTSAPNGILYFQDTASQDWEYRVRVQTKSGKTGEAFQTANLHAVPPPDLSTYIQFHRVGKQPDASIVSDTLFKGDTARYIVQYTNAALSLRALVWINARGETLRTVTLSGKSGSDTLRWGAPAAMTSDTLTVRITDANGGSAIGSLGLSVFSSRIIGSIKAPSRNVKAFPWNGKIIHVGADSGQSIIIGLFDVATGRDSTLSSQAYGSEGYFTTAFWGSQVILIGAHSNDFNPSNVLTFDVATGAWAAGPSLNPAPWEISAVAADSKVYAIFGDTVSPSTRFFSTLDLTTHTWSAKKTLPWGSLESNLAVYNQKLYLLKSMNGPTTSSMDAYDPAQDAWTAIPVSKRLASTAGAQLAAVNGRVYLFGGWSMDLGLPYMNTVESYDPVLKSWMVNGPFLRPRAYSGIVALGAKFYLVGGMTTDSQAIATVEEYQP